MNANLLIQYTLVGLCILAAIIWIIVKVSRRKNNAGGCCGCSLADTCKRIPQQKPGGTQTHDCCDKKQSAPSKNSPKEN